MELTPRTISEQVDHADAETCLKMLRQFVSPSSQLWHETNYMDAIGIDRTATLRHVVKCHLLEMEVNS